MPKSALILTLLIAARVVCASTASAQSNATVTGRVTDPKGQPLRGVLVSVPGLGTSVATSANGHYVLFPVPTGRQLLHFRLIAFAAREVTVEVTPGAPTTADVVLEPQPIELSAILVEGVSRAPDRMIEARHAGHR